MSGAAFHLFLIAALALAACGKPAEKDKPLTPAQSVKPSLCSLVSFHDAALALGAPPVGATDTADSGALNPGCSWMAANENFSNNPRMLVFTVWRKGALDMQGATMSGRALYVHEVKEISEEFGAVHAVPGVGEDARIGFGLGAAGELRAKIVAVKGSDVLTMQLTGADRAQFEAIAARVAESM